MFQGQAHLNNLYTELIIEVSYAEHLWPETFASYCIKKKNRKERLKGYFLTFETYDLKTYVILQIKSQMFLTGKWVDSNGGTHFLKLNPELWVLSDFLFMFAGKLLQVGLECLQLLRHLAEKKQKQLISPTMQNRGIFCIQKQRYGS